MEKISGFTFTELLIIVAIVAILAAIAVPNLFEAQERTKVARAKNDIRSACVALESYMVDWKTYPAPRVGYAEGEGPWCATSLPYAYELTTPVAYLPTVANMIDSFWLRNPWYSLSAKWGFRSRPEMPLQYINFDPKCGIWGKARYAEDRNSKLWVAAVVTSSGPNRMLCWPEWYVFENAPYQRPYIMIPFGTQQDPVQRASAWSVVYDPTNGATSRGGIFRFVGALETPGQ